MHFNILLVLLFGSVLPNDAIFCVLLSIKTLSTMRYLFLCSTGTSDVRQTEAPVTRDAYKLEVSVKIPTVLGSPNKPPRMNGGTRSPGSSTSDMMAAPMNRDTGADDLPVYSPMRRLPKQSSITDDNDSGKESICHTEWDKSEIFKTPAIPSADVQRSNSYVNDSVVVRRPKPAVRARNSHRLSMPVMNASMLASHTAQFGKRESVIESLEKKRRESIGTRLKGLQVPVSSQHRNTSGPMKALPTIIGQKTQVGILPKLHPMTKRHSYQMLVPTTFNVKPLKVQPSAVYQMEPPKSRVEPLKDASVESRHSIASAVRNDELNDKVDDVAGLPGYTPVVVHDNEVSLSSCDKDDICVTKTNLANSYNMLNDDSADGTTDKKPLLPEQGNKEAARYEIVANDGAEMLPSVLNDKDEDLVSLPATTKEVDAEDNVTSMINAIMSCQSGDDTTAKVESELDTDNRRQVFNTPESQETLNTPEVGDPSPPQSDIVSLDIKQNFHGITIVPTSVAADVKSVSSPKPSLPPKPRKPSVPPKPSKARIMSSLDHSLNGTAADTNEIDPMMKTEYAVNVKSSDEHIAPEEDRCLSVNDVTGESGGVMMTEIHNTVQRCDEAVTSSSLVDVTSITEGLSEEIMVATSSQSLVTIEDTVVPPMVPDMAPPLMPGITPPSVPDVVLAAVPAPELAQPSMPDTAPPSVPDVPPPAVPVAIPSLHDIALSFVPEIAAPLIPDMAPPSVPEVSAPSIPDVAPPSVPGVALPSITNEDPLVALEDTALPLESASSFINNDIPSVIQDIPVQTEDTDLVPDIPSEFTPDVARPLPTYATPYEPESNPTLLPDLAMPSNLTTSSAPEITLSSEDTEEDNLLQNIIDAVLSSPTANAPDHPPFDMTVSSPVDVTASPPSDEFVLESDYVVGSDASVLSAPMLSLPEINICPPTPTRELGSPLDFKCDDVTVDVAADVTAAVVTDESTDVVADEVVTDVSTHTVDDIAMDTASEVATNTATHVVSDTTTDLEAQEDDQRLETELQSGGTKMKGEDTQIRTDVAFPISDPVTQDIPHGLDEIVSSHCHDPEISPISEPLKITTTDMSPDSFNAPQLPSGPPPTSPPPATPPADLDLDLHATSGSVDLSDMSHFDSSDELEGNFARGALPQTSSPMISVALKEDEGRGSLLSSPDINGPLSPTPSDTDSGIYSSRAETSKSDTGGSYFFKSIFFLHLCELVFTIIFHYCLFSVIFSYLLRAFAPPGAKGMHNFSNVSCPEQLSPVVAS